MNILITEPRDPAKLPGLLEYAVRRFPKEMGSNGRKKAKSEFSIQTMVHKIEELYEGKL